MGIASRGQGAGAVFPSLAEKVRFLCDPASYAARPAAVETIETHMSYVFLAGARAYKLKKPVLYPFLDFSTLEARERDCREEVRLNRRLAAGVYFGVAPLVCDGPRLSIGGEGAIVDWLVVMRRLPRVNMLDRLITADGVGDGEVNAVCDTLADFYQRAERSDVCAQDYVNRFLAEEALSRDILTRADFPFPQESRRLLDRLDVLLSASRAQLEARVGAGLVLDGHGDLRPEHICLNHPIVIFDCLEFNKALRQVDPFDEIALLGVECALLGAPQLLPRFVLSLARRLNCAPPWDLVALYGAWRAALRARLSFAHLIEPCPREVDKWAPRARSYLAAGENILSQDFRGKSSHAVS